MNMSMILYCHDDHSSCSYHQALYCRIIASIIVAAMVTMIITVSSMINATIRTVHDSYLGGCPSP